MIGEVSEPHATAADRVRRENLDAPTSSHDDVEARIEPRAELVAPGAMSKEQRDELWEFFSPIVSRSREQFERALQAFPLVRFWRHPSNGRLLGFAASRWIELDVDGERVDVLYFGWAALSRSLRGRGLPYWDGFVRYWWQALRNPFRRSYLVFAASTTKSYKSLARYAPDCWPHPDRPMPKEVERVVATLMRELGEHNYDPELGIIRRYGALRYHEGVVADDRAMMADPLVAYYAARNPRQHEGDTLVVAFRTSVPNIFRYLWRVASSRFLGRRA